MKTAGNTKWWHVWSGPLIDGVFDSSAAAKRHAAWLDFTFAHTTWWRKRVEITGPDGQSVSFADYEFRAGQSRKRRLNQS